MSVQTFWSVEGIREELSHWHRQCGPKFGPGYFWGQQQVQDLYREHTRGKKVTRAEIETAHALALKWNEWMDSDPEDFWGAYHYDACASNKYVSWDMQGTYAVVPRANGKYAKSAAEQYEPKNTPAEGEDLLTKLSNQYLESLKKLQPGEVPF